MGITATPSRGHGRRRRMDDPPTYNEYGPAHDPAYNPAHNPAVEDVYIRPIGGGGGCRWAPQDTSSRWEPRGGGPGVSYAVKGAAGAAELEDMKGIKAPTYSEDPLELNGFLNALEN